MLTEAIVSTACGWETMAKRGTEKAWPMDELQLALVESLEKSNGFEELSPKKRAKIILKVTRKSAKAIGKDLLDRAPKMLAQRRSLQIGFEARNFRRWRKAFDLIETLWVCCEEIGRNFNQNFRPEAVQTQDFIFEAMTTIHARSLLVGEEIICLMKGGFADAALTRWRTLHEFTVVAILISQGDQQLALRYLAHADVQAAENMDSDDLAKDDSLQALKARSDYRLAQFGDSLKKHYGWASDLVGKKQPNFEDLEKKAEKSEIRYFYKYASQHIHSNHRACDQLIGVTESDEPILLVGSSNSGMVAPLTLASMSMAEITALYLNTKPNFDRAIYTAALMTMAARMNKLASRLEKTTLQAAQKRKRPKVAA